MVYSYTFDPEGQELQKGKKRRSRRFFWAVLLLVFFAVASFGAGILIADKFPSLNEYLKFEITKKAEVPASTAVSSGNLEQEPAAVQEEQPAQVGEEPNDQVSQNISEPVKFSFAVLGDTQYFKAGSNGGFQKAVANIKKMDVSLVMADGDLNSSCSSDCVSKLNSWKSVLGNLAAVAYPTQGNHDRTGGKEADKAWQEAFSLPTNGPSGFSELTYSFDFENSHFVVLDSDNPKEHIVNSVQRDWLEKDLSSNEKENTFVFFHEPAFPVSSKIGESLDVDPGERDALWNILAAHKVTAVFSGHEHIHSRRKVNGIYQFVFGNTNSSDHDLPKSGVAEYAYKGQNFGIVKVEDKKITVEAYSIDGKLLNSFTF